MSMEARTGMRRAEWQGDEQQQRQADEGNGQCHGGGAPLRRPPLSPPREPNKIAPPVGPHPEKMRTEESFRRKRGVGARKRWILFSFSYVPPPPLTLSPVTPALGCSSPPGNALGLTGFSPPLWD